jgi:DHA1 family tetracycline resistance protein-like MFS transporter
LDSSGRILPSTALCHVQSVSQLLGLFLFMLTFAWFIGAQAPLKLPGAPFLLASVLLLLALLIAARVTAATGRGQGVQGPA